jgi:hypothetical protein
MGLRTSAVAGVCSALLSVVLYVGEIPQIASALPISSLFLFVATLAFLLCYAIYVHGFVIIGKRRANALLVLVSYVLITVVLVDLAGTFAFIVFSASDTIAATILELVIVFRSSTEMLVGMSLWSTRHAFGRVGAWTAATGILLGGAGFFLGNPVGLLRIPFLLFGGWLFVQASNATPSEKVAIG